MENKEVTKMLTLREAIKMWADQYDWDVIKFIATGLFDFLVMALIVVFLYILLLIY